MSELLDSELEMLLYMYPELQIEQQGDILLGKLQFSIELSKAIRVTFENNKDIELDTFPNNFFWFQINKTVYPHFQKCLEYNLKNDWMSTEDIFKIRNNVEAVFTEMEDDSGETDPDTPLLTILLDHIRNLDSVFEDIYSCKSLAQYETFQKLAKQNKQNIFNSMKYTCSICLEIFRGQNMITLPCNEHNLCKLCFESYYTTMIDQGEMNSMRCPECPFKNTKIGPLTAYDTVVATLFTPALPFEFFEEKLNPSMCKKYQETFQEQAFLKLEQQINCSCIRCPRCEKWCLRKDMDDKMVHCEDCSMNFCFFCQHSWHGRFNPCKDTLNKIPVEYLEEYIDDQTTLNRRLQFEKRFGKNTLKKAADSLIADKLLDEAIENDPFSLGRCPKCRAAIERSEGCNKMKCPMCGITFCFLCGEDLDPSAPYRHFSEIGSDCYQKLFLGMPGAS
ncbi:hypothetical protein ACO0RG_002115 [Hanseniaspora osmophila]